METLGGHKELLWSPLSYLGFTHAGLQLNAATIINTWLVLGVLTLLLITARALIARHNKIAIYLFKEIVGGFKELVEQSLGYFHEGHCLFALSIFLFILGCNWISLLPGAEEPTADLNTAISLGLISFFYRDGYAIKEHGFWGFFSEFLHPFFLMLPLNLIGHLSKVISISFRLFGNIFGGAIITKIYSTVLGNSLLFQLGGLLTGVNFIVTGFFILFEGFIQAFVFSVLSLTYLAMSLQKEE